MTQRGPRTVGRIRVLQIFAAPLDEDAALDGCRLERTERDGMVELEAVGGSGERLGVLRVYLAAHGDPFYGRYSRVEDGYAYASKLEVEPAARGRGLGGQLMRAGRCVAFEASGRGLKSLVAPDNDASLRCHEVAGYDPPSLDLRGLRIGPRVLWLGRTHLAP